MLEKFLNIFRIPDLRKRVLFTLGILAVYRLGSFISTPGVNPAVLAFTFILAIVTGVLFGVFPALQMSRPDLHEELKGGAGASISHGRRRRFISNLLVVGEIALSLMLLLSAGLLLEDFARMRNLDIGVRREGVVRKPSTS